MRHCTGMSSTGLLKHHTWSKVPAKEKRLLFLIPMRHSPVLLYHKHTAQGTYSPYEELTTAGGREELHAVEVFNLWHGGDVPVGVVCLAGLRPLPQPIVVEVGEAAPPPGQTLLVKVWVEIFLGCLSSAYVIFIWFPPYFFPQWPS